MISFTVYMIAIMTHSISKLVYFEIQDNSNVTVRRVFFNWSIQLFLIIVVLMHSPVVFLQLKSQIGKLCRKEDEPQKNLDETTTNNDYENDMLKTILEDAESVRSYDPRKST